VQCHGATGNSLSPVVPRIAGQQITYMKSQIEGYKNGTLEDADSGFMRDYIGNLSFDDLDIAAQYYASQTPTKNDSGDPVRVARGKDFYDNGIPEKGVMACQYCHGSVGEGMEGMGPRMAQQHANYLYRQIEFYKEGSRPDPSGMMSGAVQNLDMSSMTDIAYYLQSL
jgi:cytochrome c553